MMSTHSGERNSSDVAFVPFSGGGACSVVLRPCFWAVFGFAVCVLWRLVLLVVLLRSQPKSV